VLKKYNPLWRALVKFWKISKGKLGEFSVLHEDQVHVIQCILHEDKLRMIQPVSHEEKVYVI
jgi:hypothetical protein